jgi:hypothetical protein
MRSIQLAVVTLSAIAFVSFTSAAPALAKQKQAKTPNYQEAWAACKKFTDEGVWSWDQHGQRLQRGGSCMLRYGYKFADFPD